MKYAFIVLMLAVSACTTLTGDPAADCLAARNAVIQAQTLTTASAAIAASNPQSERMQTAAALASANLASAIGLQTAVCPPPKG